MWIQDISTLLIAGVLITHARSNDVGTFPPPDSAHISKENSYPSPKQHVTTGVRNKRIIHGFVVRNIALGKHTIGAIQYYVVMSHAHQCSFHHRELFNNNYTTNEEIYDEFKAHCVDPSRNPRCSGAMIAPNVVQTACHCLATFYKFRPDKNRTSALEKSVWEDHNIVFRPAEDPSDVTRPEKDTERETSYLKAITLATMAETQFMFSKKYYIHQRCTHLDRRIFSHDFGLIILSSRYLDVPTYMFKVPRPNLGRNFRALPPSADPEWYAPIYSVATADENWAWVNRVQPTCLIIGTGWTVSAYGVFLELPRPWQVSYIWRSVISYSACSKWMSQRLPDIKVEGGWQLEGMNTTYKDIATWFCTLRLTRFGNSYASLGDDGGPVTCDNRFIGILGAGFPHSSEYNFLSETEFIHSLSYATESLAEYRQGLLELVTDKRPFLDPQFPPFNPVVYQDLIPNGDAPLVKRSLPRPTSVSPMSTSGAPTKPNSFPNYLTILLFIYSP